MLDFIFTAASAGIASIFILKLWRRTSKESYFPFNISAAPQTLYSAGFHSFYFINRK
jgi:hypothetical protein